MSGDVSRRRARRAIRWTVVAALAGTSLWLAAATLDDGGRWARVERRDLVITVPIEGELRAVHSTTLGPPQIENTWNFKLASLAEEGTEVQEGDPVMSFDGNELRQSLRRTVAERDQAEKQLEKKITDLEIERRDLELSLEQAQARLRKAELLLDVPVDVIADNELESARIDQRLARLEVGYLEKRFESLAVRERLDVGSLRSRRDLAASRVRQMEKDIERLTVRAPRAGTVLHLTTWRGEKAKVGDQVWRMRNIAEIPDLSIMEATAEVAEGDAGRVGVDQKVSFRLDAYPDREYTARVAAIRRAVQRKSRSNPSKVVQVMLEIADTDVERMRPGMRMRGRVEIDRIEQVLAVPEGAVTSSPEGAWVVTGGWLDGGRVFPEFGRRDGRYFEVVSGLDEGASVRLGGEG